MFLGQCVIDSELNNLCVIAYVTRCILVHVFFNAYLSKTYHMKRHFYARDKFMRIRQNGFRMHSSTLCIVTYGVIKNYAVQIYVICAWLA